MPEAPSEEYRLHVGWRILEIPVGEVGVLADWLGEGGYPISGWNARRPPPGIDLIPYWGDDRFDGLIWRVGCHEIEHAL
jgi:hypothetical protein